jgi:hypothetical protein
MHINLLLETMKLVSKWKIIGHVHPQFVVVFLRRPRAGRKALFRHGCEGKSPGLGGTGRKASATADAVPFIIYGSGEKGNPRIAVGDHGERAGGTDLRAGAAGFMSGVDHAALKVEG